MFPEPFFSKIGFCGLLFAAALTGASAPAVAASNFAHAREVSSVAAGSQGGCDLLDGIITDGQPPKQNDTDASTEAWLEGPPLKTVVLVRHGVRSPTQSEHTLQSWTRHEWPKWSVPPGYLTVRGASLVREFWRLEGERMCQQKALSAPCPANGEILVLSDLDERTRATAKALVEGLAPQCGIPCFVNETPPPDPLFHPVEAKKAFFQPEKIQKELSNQKLEELSASLQTPLKELAAALGPASPEWCREKHLTPNCNVTEEISRVQFSHANRHVSLAGGLGTASSIAEILLLAYAENHGRTGFVGIKSPDAVLPVHTNVFNTLNRAPAIAGPQGGALAAAMSAALVGIHPNPRFNNARLVILVGHDTNIAALGQLLNLQWNLGGYPENSTPPGAALALHLMGTPDGPAVQATFTVQPLAALKGNGAIPPPERQSLRWNLPELAGQRLCPLKTFLEFTKRYRTDAPYAFSQPLRQEQ